MWFIPTIINRMLVKGDPDYVCAVFDYIKGFPGENYLFDLNSIIPMPDCIKITAEQEGQDVIIEMYGEYEVAAYRERCAAAELRCLVETGYPGWFEWSLAHWDTPWNVSQVEQSENRVDVLYFCSAGWSPHNPLQDLSRLFPDVVIALDYYDSGGDSLWHALFVEGDGCLEYHPKESDCSEDIWEGLKEFINRNFGGCDSVNGEDEWSSVIYVD